MGRTLVIARSDFNNAQRRFIPGRGRPATVDPISRIVASGKLKMKKGSGGWWPLPDRHLRKRGYLLDGRAMRRLTAKQAGHFLQAPGP